LKEFKTTDAKWWQ